MAILCARRRLAGLGVDGPHYVAGVYSFYWGFYPRAGSLHGFYLALLAIMLGLGLAALFTYRRAVEAQRLKVNQINYVIVSTIIYSMASIDFLANYGVGFYPLGMLFTNLHAAIIAYAIVQYRLLDINVALKRSLISGLILAALLVPCYMIVIASQQFAFGAVSLTFSLLTLALLVGVAFLFQRLRFIGEDALERALFQKNTDHREALLKSSREMVSVVDINELSERLVRATSRAIDSDRAALYLYDTAKSRFSLTAVVGIDHPRHFSDPVLGRNDALVQALAQSRACFVREELAMAQGPIETTQAAERMVQLGAEVSVPILSKNKLAGILNLGA